MEGGGLTSADLFCGIGGFALGLKEHGVRPVFACDTDPAARAAFAAHHGIEPSAEDISKVDYAGVGAVDILTSGFPCQPFSSAGMRLGMDDPRASLGIHETLRAIRELRPRAVMLENVTAFTRGSGLPVMMEALREAGYAVHGPHVLRAVEFGLAQTRERMMIVAIRDDVPGCRGFRFPCPPCVAPSRSIASMLGAAPSERTEGANILRRARFGDIRDNVGGVMETRVGGKIEQTIARTRFKTTVARDDLPLPTITRRCNNIVVECPGGGEFRRLTIVEKLRAQGFPDDYGDGIRPSITLNVGNAIPPPFARAVGKTVVDLLTVK